MGGIYTLGADGIYYPNLVSTDEEPHYGKYGMMRKTYLKEYRPAMYSLYIIPINIRIILIINLRSLNVLAVCTEIFFHQFVIW